jgi:glycosyltransferase involved in cell wall biosynthesis
MPTKGLVSIILPCYNSEQYIVEAINSVLLQSYTLWELLVINDGSSDSSLALIYQFHDQRIQVHSQHNLGVSAARNVGLTLARGEFITFLDADDTLPPHSLFCRVFHLNANPHVSVVCGTIARFDKNMKSLVSLDRFSYNGYMLDPLARLSSTVFTLPFYMFRSSFLGDTFFNTSLTHCEDIMFFLQMCTTFNLYLESICSSVYHYRTGHSSAMSDLSSMNKCLLTLNNYIATNPKISPLSKLIARFRIAKIVFLQSLALRHFKNAIVYPLCSLGVI